MATPTVKSIPEWQWTKVATNVVTGTVHCMNTIVNYYQTFRDTGDAAPVAPTVGTVPTEAVRMFDKSLREDIDSSYAIDVYVMGQNNDDDSNDTGSVRIDL